LNLLHSHEILIRNRLEGLICEKYKHTINLPHTW